MYARGEGRGTNVFRVPRAEAAADVRVLRELRELWGLDELLLHVRLAHFGPVEVAAVRERVELRMARLGRRRRGCRRRCACVGGEGGDERRVGRQQKGRRCWYEGLVLDCAQGYELLHVPGTKLDGDKRDVINGNGYEG